VTGTPAVPSGVFAVKPAYRFRRSLSILSAIAATAGCIYTLNKSGTARTLVTVRNLERRLRVRVQHDLRIAQTGILQLHCIAFDNVIGHKLWRYRHIDGIARLCQYRLVIAVHQVPHHEVPYQGGQSIGRHQF